MNDFRTDHKMTRAGITWFCQSPGSSWMTDPNGWELYLTDGPAWHLFGIGDNVGRAELSLGTRRLKEAMDTAAEEIAKREERATG